MNDDGNLTPNDFDLMDDLKLMGYGESDSSGAWIKLQILPEHLETFRGLRGELFEVTMRRLDNDHKPVKAPKITKKYGQNANILFKSGFFYNPAVVKHIGSDDEYQDWCRGEPCVVCKQFGEIVQEGMKHAGEGRNIYAHVTRAGRDTSGGRGAGSNKPIYSGVPMCNRHHQMQHNPGEIAPYNEYLKIQGKKTVNNSAVAKSWFEEQAGRHLASWAHSKFATDFGYSSLALVPPKKVVDWCTTKGVLFYLPNGFLVATDGET